MTKARDLANLLGGGTSGVATFGGTAAIRVPNGTTAQRPTPALGMVRYNTTLGVNEVYDANGWVAIAAPPSISSVSPVSYNGESGTSFTIDGANFDAGATVKFLTAGGTEYGAATVTRVSSAQLTATTPQDFTVADEPLAVKVVNATGLSSTLDAAIDCGGVPAWSTSAGQLGATVLEGQAYSQTLVATDPDAGATVTYSIVSGALPSGITLNSSTGAISGTAPDVAATTTYNFTVAATDNAGNSTSRAFSIVVDVNLVADSGGGEGYATEYSVATNADQVTNTSNTILFANVQAATPNNPAGWLDFTNYGSNTSQFKIHTGHDGVTPNRLAVRVSTGTPRVLNRYRWIKHTNAAGNIDIYGSNKAIDSGNWTNMDNWTHLGRGHMGGSGSEGDGTVKTASFNPNNYGYRWYMVLVRDNSSTPLAFPNQGTMQGYAMYGATFDKV